MLTSSAAELDSPPPSGTEDMMTASKETCGPETGRCLFSVNYRYVTSRTFENVAMLAL